MSTQTASTIPRHSPSWSPLRNSLATLALIALAACGSDTTDPPEPVTISISPTTATLQGGGTQLFTATVANGATNEVTWTSSGGTLTGSGNSRTFTAPISGGNFTVTATSVDDATKKASASVTVTAVSVAISPSNATADAGGTVAFNATVNGSSNSAVTWTATAGTINGNGNSATLTTPVTGGSVTVTATSVADPTKSGTASVTVSRADISISPSASTVYRGEGVTLNADVTGIVDKSLEWSASCGTIAGSGQTVVWTAPEAAGSCTVAATSALDDSRSDEAELTIRREWRAAATDDNDDGACTWSHCSIREAINAANANPDVDTVRIVSAAAGASSAFGMRVNTLNDGATIKLGNALPPITTTIHIIGPGSSNLTIDAAASTSNPRRVFTFNSGSGSVQGVTLTGGFLNNEPGGAVRITDDADISLTDVAVAGNTVVAGYGGGISVEAGTATLTNVAVTDNKTTGNFAPGGGISVVNNGTLSVTGGSISDNEVTTGWGGGLRIINGTASFTDVTISRNKSTVGGGGGLLAEEGITSITLNGVTLEDNQTTGGGGAIRVLNGATASITNSTFRGNKTGGVGGTIEAGNVPALSISGSTITESRSETAGGALYMWGTNTANITGTDFTDNYGRDGGAIMLRDNTTVTITGGILDNNSAQTNGGAMGVLESSILTLNEVTATNNRVLGNAFAGGAVAASGPTEIIVNGGTFADNSTAIGAGGAFFNSSGKLTLNNITALRNLSDGNYAGGAVFVINGANLTVNGGTYSDNRATYFGGAISVWGADAVIRGATFTQDSALAGGAISVTNDGTLVADSITISDNKAFTSGGGVYIANNSVVTITGSSFSGNRTVNTDVANAPGGGIYRNAGTGKLTIHNSTFTNNTAWGQGGGINITGSGASELDNLTLSGNSSRAGGGGALVAQHTAVITNSTFSGNTTVDGQTPGYGGGLAVSSTAIATITNSTFSGNSAEAHGGGLASNGASTILNSTFVDNVSALIGGGLGSASIGTYNVRNTLLSGNKVGTSPGNCGIDGTAAITSQGNNLSDDNCQFFVHSQDKNNTEAGVEPQLKDNGGATLTHALLAGSAAINAGNQSACPAVDQRGAPRVGVCDIGAFEFGAAAPARRNSASAPARIPAPVRRSQVAAPLQGAGGAASAQSTLTTPPIQR